MRGQSDNLLKSKVLGLRRSGKTYSEIKKSIGKNIPKSTLSTWCSQVVLNRKQKKRIADSVKMNILNGQKKALVVIRKKRESHLAEIDGKIKNLKNVFLDKSVAKIALAMLYLGEGAKSRKGSLMLGNSNPDLINLFVHLLRKCYLIDEGKFRCTVQCRADQNIPELEDFWSRLTKISLNQFYKARIDPRTIGKKSLKTDYKGVCRIDYFSADIYIELKKIGELLSKQV